MAKIAASLGNRGYRFQADVESCRKTGSAGQADRLCDWMQAMEEVGLIAARATPAGQAARGDNFLLFAVIPCFNEEHVIRLTHRRLVDVLGNRDFCLQIAFVDDGSDDATPNMAAEIGKSDPRVKTVLLSRNLWPPGGGQRRTGRCRW
jgi:Glycosyl transferase family 2